MAASHSMLRQNISETVTIEEINHAINHILGLEKCEKPKDGFLSGVLEISFTAASTKADRVHDVAPLLYRLCYNNYIVDRWLEMRIPSRVIEFLVFAKKELSKQLNINSSLAPIVLSNKRDIIYLSEPDEKNNTSSIFYLTDNGIKRIKLYEIENYPISIEVSPDESKLLFCGLNKNYKLYEEEINIPPKNLKEVLAVNG